MMNGNVFHIHIENSTRLGEVFRVNKERLDFALTKQGDLRSRLHITIGEDGKGCAEQLATTQALFAWEFERGDLERRAPRLQLIHLPGAGADHLLPLDWLPASTTLTNSRGAHRKRGAEYLIMALLMLNNGIPAMAANQRVAQWMPIHNTAIAGKTALIFGVGHIGGEAAKWAKTFELTVIGVRRTGAPHPHVDEMHQPAELHRLLPRADFLLVTAPSTKETRRVFGRRELNMLRSGAGIIVYSRPDLVDYDALVEKLQANELSAVVDVCPGEPLPPVSPLWTVPNLLITPHSSSNDPQWHTIRTLEIFLDNVRRILNRQPLANVVNAASGY